MKRFLPSSDPARLLAARTGDRGAWDALFDQHAPRLMAWAQTLTGGCRSDAEDLVQETFVAAFIGADKFSSKARLTTWLFGIALRKHRDKARTPRPKTLPLCDELVSPPPRADTDPLLGFAYRQALSDLPPSLREAFVLVAQHGFTHKEAAHILSIPEGTAKWRVAEATRRLRVALQDFAPTPPKDSP